MSREGGITIQRGPDGVFHEVPTKETRVEALFDILEQYGAGSMKLALHAKTDGPTTQLVIVARGEAAEMLEELYDMVGDDTPRLEVYQEDL